MGSFENHYKVGVSFKPSVPKIQVILIKSSFKSKFLESPISFDLLRLTTFHVFGHFKEIRSCHLQDIKPSYQIFNKRLIQKFKRLSLNILRHQVIKIQNQKSRTWGKIQVASYFHPEVQIQYVFILFSTLKIYINIPLKRSNLASWNFRLESYGVLKKHFVKSVGKPGLRIFKHCLIVSSQRLLQTKLKLFKKLNLIRRFLQFGDSNLRQVMLH